VDLGFDPTGVAALSVSLDGTGAGDGPSRARVVDAMLEQARALPGVAAVGAINHLPLAGDLWTLSYTVVGRPAPRPGEGPGAAYRVATPGYFAAMGERLVEGRGFTTEDRSDSLPVVIVNQALARRQWPGRSAIGAQIVVPGPDDVSDALTVVGVVADAKQQALTESPGDEVYLPLAQRPSAGSRSSMTLVARSGGPADELVTLLRQAAHSVARHAAVYEGITMAEAVDHEVWQQQLASSAAGAFAFVALCLAAIGVHGAVAYAASQRLREFGIRMALGARPAEVTRLALGAALGPVAGGLLAGLPAALVLSPLLSGQLFGVTATAPVFYVGPAAILLTAGAWAAWRPARLAGRVDPALVLRDQ
jgi:putative ABC transport system permease protein